MKNALMGFLAVCIFWLIFSTVLFMWSTHVLRFGDDEAQILAIMGATFSLVLIPAFLGVFKP